jgi:hypothetical protein
VCLSDIKDHNRGCPGFCDRREAICGNGKITHYARDFEKDPKLARISSLMKKALKTLIGQKMFKAKKDSYALTQGGRARA